MGGEEGGGGGGGGEDQAACCILSVLSREADLLSVCSSLAPGVGATLAKLLMSNQSSQASS